VIGILELREQLLQQPAQIRMIAIAHVGQQRGFMIHQVRHHRVDQLDTGVGELNFDSAPILGMKTARDKSDPLQFLQAPGDVMRRLPVCQDEMVDGEGTYDVGGQPRVSHKTLRF
jgi:hypothetical protein